jgi:hypothetical protein
VCAIDHFGAAGWSEARLWWSELLRRRHACSRHDRRHGALSYGHESFGSGEPHVFLDIAKLLVLLVVISSPSLSRTPPLIVALLFLVTVAVPGRL